MISHFKTPVIVFGIAIPLGLMGIVAIATTVISGKIDKKLELKTAQYQKSENEERQIVKLQGEISENVNHLVQWEGLIANETRGSFLEHWKKVEKGLPGREFSRSPHNWSNKNNGLGNAINHPSIQVDMKFSSTFRAMQQALIAIESRLPQMQMDSFSMSPDSEGKKLNFKTKFTIWTKN